MEGLKSFPSLIALAATILVTFSVFSVEAQLSTPCTASMVTSFTPCINFITGSTANGASPNAGCCDSVKSLMSGSMDCACLIVTGNVPISLPINRTLALSLPQACKSNLPLQCKASGVPLPAPGPVLFAPPVAPAASPVAPAASPLSPVANAPSPFSPTASKSSLAVAESPAETPAETQDETPEETPASAPVHSVAPKTTPGIKPIVTSTSASNPSYIPSPFVLVVFMGIIMVFKGY